MNKIYALLLGGAIAAAIGTYYGLTRIPIVQNTVRTALPSQSVAEPPPEDVKIFREPNQAGSVNSATFDKEYSPDEVNKFAQGLYGDVVDIPRIIAMDRMGDIEQATRSRCVSQVISDFSNEANQMYTSEFNTALQDSFGSDFVDFGNLLEDNSSGFRPSKVPSLLLQGEIDPIVTAKTTRSVLQRMCDQGNIVDYREYPGVHHFQTRQVSFIDTLEWMEKRIGNEPPPSSC